jgi:hypothetical protein
MEQFSATGSQGLSMPLERGRIIRYDVDRMTFEFTMIDKANGPTVECKISSTAIDQRAGIKGTMPNARRNFWACGTGSSPLRPVYSTRRLSQSG